MGGVPRERIKDRQARAIKVLHGLQALYPDAATELAFTNPFELLIATILSAQATDVSVNAATPALFADFPTPKRMAAAKLEALRSAPAIDYEGVRELKRRALIAGLKVFYGHELGAPGEPTPRARSFRSFEAEHGRWLEDYALYRAIKDDVHGAPWWDWPQPLRDRDEAALAGARTRLADSILYFKYVQWLAHTQWSDARKILREHGVEIMGDLPFMVDRDSADVWAERGEFRLDMSVGCPADQFDKEGQDWGLPPYHWAVMAQNDFAWLRRRARYSGQLYDRFRIDHLVGFFRTCMRPYDARRDARGKLVTPSFDPPTEAAQRSHGERVQPSGCHEKFSTRWVRSGCGMSTLKRPSLVVSPVTPPGEPFGLSG